MEPFVGQITLFPFSFAPKNWALCQGQFLPIQQYTALFSLLGTTYGGDGVRTFALPDLRGRAPIGQGQGPGLSDYPIGSAQGAESVVLSAAESPAHSHAFPAFASTATTNAPAGASPAEGHAARATANTYAPPSAGAATTLAPAQAGPAGGGGAHANLQPYLTMNWCIALVGVFPRRS